MAAKAVDLLPRHRDEFRSREYWDKFFQERSQAFEWYGNYDDLEPLLHKYIKQSDRILVVGCGNSDLSQRMYDNGFLRITNIDFSPLVIEEMRARNEARPQMQWEVMDMTDMSFEAGSFDVVLDKGALDALMSENTSAVIEKGRRMFEELSRVLRPKGLYVCVSLCEDYIATELLGYFHEHNFAITAEIVQPKQASPFKPFLLAIGPRLPKPMPFVSARFDSLGVASASASRLPVETAKTLLPEIQQFAQNQYKFRDLHVGRFDEVELWPQEATQLPTPRFTLLITDVANRSHALIDHTCAVFFIPQGREHEWIFSTEEGLKQVAESARCCRLIAVRCNRGHRFGDIEALKAELSAVALRFAPASNNDEAIPFMAMGDERENRDIIEQGESELCGGYIIEEADDDSDRNALLRRLIFLQNPHVIQTEVRMVFPKSGGKQKKKFKKSGKGRKQEQRSPAEAALAEGAEAAEAQLTLDLVHLCFDYHRAMIAGLPLATDLVRTGDHAHSSILVIGLGGGSLPMCLRKYVPHATVCVCELDPTIVGIAERCFGFRQDEQMQVVIGDGLDVVQALADAASSNAAAAGALDVSTVRPHCPFDVIVLDVDNKDPKVGMSCPPQAFVERDYLISLKSILKPNGLLAVNVAARSATIFQQAVSNIAGAFGEQQVLTVRATADDVNTVVFASNSDPAQSASRPSLAVVTDWLQQVREPGDPLGLQELATRIELYVRQSEPARRRK